MMKNRYIYLLLLLIVTSCTISYKFNGSMIDYTRVKNIAISEFPIKAALVYPPLGPAFNEALKDAYTRQTKLSIINSSDADLMLEGEITGYDLTPQAVGENAYATMTRLTVTVKVRYTDTTNPKADVDQSFSVYKDFSSSQMLTDVQDQLVEEIVDELVTLIFNATAGSW